MKKLAAVLSLLAALSAGAAVPVPGKADMPLGDMLRHVSERFGVRLKIEVDTAGKVVKLPASRIRPYSVEETLTNILIPFDYKPVKQNAKYYKVKPYEPYRRTEADGRKLIPYLQGLYSTPEQLEARRDSMLAEVKGMLMLDDFLANCVDAKPTFSKARKFDGYKVQNFTLETLPGLYVCGSVYMPAKKGTYPIIICPNGHFGNGRYREDQQQRMATLARMGAICVDYDLFAWGESALQVGGEAHQSPYAHIIQAVNGIRILDTMLEAYDVDKARIGVNGGSGGGTQTVLLSFIDPRYTASCPVVSLSSHFDGGCPCESGVPVTSAGSGTCNAEYAAFFAPRPMSVVSDGKDWTFTVPTLEYPYLQYVYGLYGKPENVSNVHLPTEGHDFGINKRNAVYDFFIKAFSLDGSKLDETKVTIEPFEALYSFSNNPDQLPAGAIRSMDELLAIIKNFTER